MLVICEDCAKKYNIDESRIKSRRARFTCNECGHIIIIDKEDVTRSLLTGRSSEPAPTLDLLREMEVPLASGQGGEVPATPAGAEEGLIKRKNRGVPVFVLFLVVMLVFLGGASLLFGYFYAGHIEATYLAEVFQGQAGLRRQFILESSLLFCLAGACTLFLFCVLARALYEMFRKQVEFANRLSIGDYDITINTRGPREIRDLAFALERIRVRLKEGEM